jgi:ABC-type Mn2+/Zn2+ transport system ATPase subunit
MKAIELKGITVVLNHRTILKNTDMALEKGSLTYLMGSNGSGKTTLIKSILQLVPITKGSISIFNEPVSQKNISSRISYLAQYPKLDRDFPISVSELINLACSTQKHCPLSIEEHLQRFDALEIKDKKLEQLSGGQLQKVLIARALIGDKDILILDEPFNNLDHRSEERLIQILKEMHNEQGKTILIVTHDQSIVNKDNDCLMLAHGHLHAGKAEKVLAEHKLEII